MNSSLLENELTKLSHDELVDKYLKLEGNFKTAQQKCEKYLQELHNIRTELNTVTAVQRELSGELETIHDSYLTRNNEMISLHKQAVDSMKTNLRENSFRYENEIEILNETVEKLKNNLIAETKNDKNCVCAGNTRDGKNVSELQEAVSALTLQNAEALDDFKITTAGLIHEKHSLLKERDNLMEELKCSKENFSAKKGEAEELLENVQELQQNNMSLQLELNSFKNSTDQIGAKGNSLFAEVDDRRVKLEKIVRDQRATFLEMKRKHMESSRQNAGLKSQIGELDRQLANVRKIIGSEDTRLIEQYRARSTDLEKQLREVRDHLNERETFFGNNARQHGEGFVDGIMKHYRPLIKDLQTQVESRALKQIISEEALQISQKEMIRWKAEALQAQSNNLKLELQLKELKCNTDFVSDGSEIVEEVPSTSSTISQMKNTNVIQVKENRMPIPKIVVTETIPTNTTTGTENIYAKPLLVETTNKKPLGGKEVQDINIVPVASTSPVQSSNDVFKQPSIFKSTTSGNASNDTTSTIARSILKEESFNSYRRNKTADDPQRVQVVKFCEGTYSPEETDRQRIKKKRGPRIPFRYMKSAREIHEEMKLKIATQPVPDETESCRDNLPENNSTE